MSALFSPITLRGVTFANRVGVSPMCQYSSEDGFAADWHLVHLGGLATGGAGLVFTEAAAVLPEGRISPQDLGLWQDAHIPMLQRIVTFMRAQGTVPGIQLAHAGRKASTRRPWSGHGAVPAAEGGWTVKAPSAVAFAPDYPQPEALTLDELPGIVEAFVAATHRALAAGFQVVEIHASHGYLLHAFMSPLANQRTDRYGGSFENRVRLTLEVTAAVRAAPDRVLVPRGGAQSIEVAAGTAHANRAVAVWRCGEGPVPGARAGEPLARAVLDAAGRAALVVPAVARERGALQWTVATVLAGDAVLASARPSPMVVGD
jgi:2,4-dienoyl-CoA reductase-like NADH-dependent reductase (Old Yellow Enzyme family)